MCISTYVCGACAVLACHCCYIIVINVCLPMAQHRSVMIQENNYTGRIAATQRNMSCATRAKITKCMKRMNEHHRIDHRRVHWKLAVWHNTSCAYTMRHAYEAAHNMHIYT